MVKITPSLHSHRKVGVTRGLVPNRNPHESVNDLGAKWPIFGYNDEVSTDVEAKPYIGSEGLLW